MYLCWFRARNASRFEYISERDGNNNIHSWEEGWNFARWPVARSLGFLIVYVFLRRHGWTAGGGDVIAKEVCGPHETRRLMTRRALFAGASGKRVLSGNYCLVRDEAYFRQTFRLYVGGNEKINLWLYFMESIVFSGWKKSRGALSRGYFGIIFSSEFDKNLENLYRFEAGKKKKFQWVLEQSENSSPQKMNGKRKISFPLKYEIFGINNTVSIKENF